MRCRDFYQLANSFIKSFLKNTQLTIFSTLFWCQHHQEHDDVVVGDAVDFVKGVASVIGIAVSAVSETAVLSVLGVTSAVYVAVVFMIADVTDAVVGDAVELVMVVVTVIYVSVFINPADAPVAATVDTVIAAVGVAFAAVAVYINVLGVASAVWFGVAFIIADVVAEKNIKNTNLMPLKKNNQKTTEGWLNWEAYSLQ